MSMANMGKIGENLTEAGAKIATAEMLLVNEVQIDSDDAEKLMWLSAHAADVRKALDSFFDNLTHFQGMADSGDG